MSFFDDASLAFLPSGGAGKDGKAYSIKPTDGTGDFTFSRGSNLTATRVGPTGLIEKGRENLFLQSNQFDTTWFNALGSGSSITSGHSGYDGSSDAWLLSKTSDGGQIYQNQSYSGVSTYSVYAKPSASNWMLLVVSTSTEFQYAYFDISNGSIGTNDYLIDVSIVDAGNGWYRCSVVTSGNNITRLRIYPAEGNNNVNGTGSIYIQDAQLEVGLAATDYIESGASTGKAGLLENEPRFDYSGGATCPSLLLEPQRVNLLPQSEYFGAWDAIGSTQTLINDTNPIDSVAYEIESSVTASPSRIYQNGLMTLGNDYSSSYLVKPSSNSPEYLGFACISNLTPDVLYNFATDSFEDNIIVGNAAKCESISMNNGWKLLKVPVHENVANTRFNIYQGSKVGSQLNGTTGQSYYLKFAQLEAGSYPTSYIPNHSGGSATRTGDITDRGANLSYTGNYTLFMEFELTQDAVYLLNSNNSTAYSLFIENDDCYFFFGRTGGDSGFVQFVNKFNWAANLGTNIKMAFYKNGTSSKMFVNGTEYTPSANTLSTGNEVLDWRYLNYSTTAERQEQAYIKQLLEFEEALSDADCISLTTL